MQTLKRNVRVNKMSKWLKKYLPIGLSMFFITLVSRISLNNGTFELNHLLSATIMAIIFMLTTAFFDSHPMNDKNNDR